MIGELVEKNRFKWIYKQARKRYGRDWFYNLYGIKRKYKYADALMTGATIENETKIGMIVYVNDPILKEKTFVLVGSCNDIFLCFQESSGIFIRMHADNIFSRENLIPPIKLNGNEYKSDVSYSSDISDN